MIVDQFEELFTQNGAEVQQRFTELFERLVLEADTHVLLCMRDDFLFRCHEHDALKPSSLNSAQSTRRRVPLSAEPSPNPACSAATASRTMSWWTRCSPRWRASVARCRYWRSRRRRLWEQRDKGTGLLTREAYRGVGGVGGALAQHAEATIDHIGVERIPIVRELFRNLVTAEGTRAVREWDELLSIFSDSQSESPAKWSSASSSTPGC